MAIVSHTLMRYHTLLVMVVTNVLCIGVHSTVKEMTPQQLQGQVEEEKSWELKYRQLSEFNNSTIQLLEEEKERMREEIESLRTQQVAQPMTEHSPKDTRGDMNGTSVTTNVAISTESNGMHTLQKEICYCESVKM